MIGQVLRGALMSSKDITAEIENTCSTSVKQQRKNWRIVKFMGSSVDISGAFAQLSPCKTGSAEKRTASASKCVVPLLGRFSVPKNRIGESDSESPIPNRESNRTESPTNRIQNRLKQHPPRCLEAPRSAWICLEVLKLLAHQQLVLLYGNLDHGFRYRIDYQFCWHITVDSYSSYC